MAGVPSVRYKRDRETENYAGRRTEPAWINAGISVFQKRQKKRSNSVSTGTENGRRVATGSSSVKRYIIR